jgi:hypothetical protein
VGEAEARRAPTVTVAGEERLPSWTPPRIEVTRENAQALAEQADEALMGGRFADDDAASLPLFMALRDYAPMRARAEAGVRNSIDGLLLQARQQLGQIDEEPDALARVRHAAAVLRVVALERDDVQRFLQQVDRVEDGQRFSELGEAALARGEVGETGGEGALAWFRRALALRGSDTRARQRIARTTPTPSAGFRWPRACVPKPAPSPKRAGASPSRAPPASASCAMPVSPHSYSRATASNRRVGTWRTSCASRRRPIPPPPSCAAASSSPCTTACSCRASASPTR